MRYFPLESSLRPLARALVRAGIDSVSINLGAAVFTRKLVASIEQRIMLKRLDKLRLTPTGTSILMKSRAFFKS